FGAPTILGWELFLISLTLCMEQTPRDAGRSGATETTLASVGLPRAAQLGWAAGRFSTRICWALSVTPGEPSLILRQRSQEPLLLPWVRTWRRSHPFCRTVLLSSFPGSGHTPETGTGAPLLSWTYSTRQRPSTSPNSR